ncbi:MULTISPECIES: HNH endonuclease [unclassified Curtobacterium]|uniref:HNH endonuclease n=1 Tax=unclassified Curtobacterium TaxID=257496 RepID=UPI0011B3D724|nr:MULTISPECIES: HNH endonuclease [unclassified Curtobacterium]
MQLTGSEVRKKIVPGIACAARRGRIDADEAVIESDEVAFRASVLAGSPGGVMPTTFSPIVKEDMTWLYETRLVGSVPGKALRGKLIDAAEGLCPYCRINVAKTLDHTVPKSEHPRLSVEPLNLVPCCRDCNMDRLVGRNFVGLSPFFDKWAAHEHWLNARVIDINHPESLVFEAIRHPGYTDSQWARLSIFFSESDLDSRYKLLALDEFYVLKGDLMRQASHYPLSSIESVLVERIKSRLTRKGLNCWEAASYGAWLVKAREIDWGV